MARQRDILEQFKSLTPDSITDMLVGLDDRSTVIVATSLLENILSFSIAYSFQHYPSESDFELLFRGYGPFATLSAKIMVGYHMGIIPNAMRHDLNTIKNLRNDFAHAFSHLSFDNKTIADKCNGLAYGTKPLANHIEQKIQNNARKLFARSIARILSIIILQFAVTKTEKDYLNKLKSKIHKGAISTLKKDILTSN